MEQAAPDPPAAAPSTLSGIRAMTPSLKAADAKVARAILADPLAIIHLTVSDTAALAGTSTATVVRCCQRLGFRGFHDLKLALAQDAAPLRQAVPGEIVEDDDPEQVLEKVLAADAAAIIEARGTLGAPDFAMAVEALKRAERVLVVAVGTSAPLAQDAAYRLLTIGIKAEAPGDTHVQHVAAGLLRPVDACLAISHTGQTRETVNAASAARAAGATSIAVTSFTRSPLTETVDIALVAGSRETSFRLEAMASRVAHIAVIDALYVALALRSPDLARSALGTTGAIIADHRF